MNIIISYIRTITIVIIITILSLMNVNEVVPKDIHFFKNFDKLVHFCMYFSFSLIFLLENNIRILHINKRLIVLITIFVGILMEFLQIYLTTTRSGSIYDVIFDCIGIFAGIVVFIKFKNKSWLYKLVLLNKKYKLHAK